MSDRRTATAVIALGSNLGKKRENLERAIEAMRETTVITQVRVSSLYLTTPIGGSGNQDDFLNAAAIVRTTASPRELLNILRCIETELRRERNEFWGARTIDLDVILYDGLLLDDPELVIPHKRLQWRLFVLDPVCELSPNATVPVLGYTFRELRTLCLRGFIFFVFCLIIRVELVVGVSLGEKWRRAERNRFKGLLSQRVK